MISRFRILFQAVLLHDYFKAGRCEEFDVVPSPETASLLERSRLLFKVIENNVLVLTAIDDAGHTAAPLSTDRPFVFHLNLRRSDFLTVTNVDSTRLARDRFYFSNLAANPSGVANAVLNLTAPIEVYDAAKHYRPGALARIGTTVFECVKAAHNEDPNASDSEFWLSRGATPYASTGDMMPLVPRIKTFTLGAPAHAFLVKVFGLDLASNTMTRLVREETIPAPGGGPSASVSVDLSAFDPGRYVLDINGDPFDAYFDDAAAAAGAFGVVEVFPHLAPASAYGLFDGAGAVREKVYTVRFANRLAFWKYVTPLNKVDDIKINGAHEQPSPFTPGSTDPAHPARKDFFLSNRPLPLRADASGDLFDLIVGSESRPAPKPDPAMPGMFTQNFDSATQTYLDHVCTVRLNY